MSDVEHLQRRLLQKAAQIANTAADRPPEALDAGEVFRETNNRSGDGYLTLSFVAGVLHGVEEPRRTELVSTLREIGVRSVRQAIAESPEIVGALILGSAKQGANYFDRFERN